MTPQTKNETPNEKMTNSITKDIEPKSCNEECKDIGKIWKRNCPKCNVELLYYSRQNLWRANKNKCLCLSCAKMGDKNPAKQGWVRKKIGISGTKYKLSNNIELTCNICGEKWNVNKRTYIRVYLKRNKIPRCTKCVNISIAHNMTDVVKKQRANKMSDLMSGRIITWNHSLKENHWTKNTNTATIIRQRISNTKSKLIADGKIKFNTGYKTGYYVSSKTGNDEYYHSSWELDRMKILDNDPNVADWTKKHNIRIPYVYNGVIHHYVPDFYIKMIDSKIILEEIKGYIKDKEVFALKCDAAEKYCKENSIEYRISYDNNTKIPD